MQIKNVFKIMFFSVVICIALYTKISASSIIESNDISIVKEHIEPGTLVLFDIDFTLLKARSSNALDVCFSEMVKYAQALGATERDAVNTVLPFYYEALRQGGADIIDPASALLIRELQSQKIYTMALTARSLPLVDCTVTQLAQAGIDFSLYSVSHDDWVFSLAESAYFHKGILFCGNNDKSEALDALFGVTRIEPKKIVYVDDKMKYLVALERLAKKKGIPFIGIRYSFLDNDVKSFVLDDENKKKLTQKLVALAPQNHNLLQSLTPA
jgi:hypothetical protein